MNEINLLMQMLVITAVIYKTNHTAVASSPLFLSLSNVSTKDVEARMILQILRQVVLGPLRAQQLTFMVPDEKDGTSAFMDEFFRNLQTPVCLLRIPQEMPQKQRFTSRNSSISKAHSDINVASDKGDSDVFPLDSSAVLIVITSSDELWWPLWLPLNHWSPSALVAVSSAPSLTKFYLRSPLLQRTPYVALICPQVSRPTMDLGVKFKVWTWLPFAAENHLVSLGSWNSDTFSSWQSLFIDRFRDMKTKQITVLGNSEDRPLIYTRHDGTPRGTNRLVLDSLSNWLNFSYTFSLGGNVYWKTMTDLLQQGVNDLMINYATLTPERNRDLAHSVPYHYEGLGLILKLPPPLPLWQNIIYPFSWIVWCGILASLFLTAVAYHCLYYRYQKSFVVNFMSISRSLISNPMATVPSQWTVRNFLMMWWMASWLIAISYTCNLIAVLTVPVFPKKIQTAEELAKSSYRLCILDYGDYIPEALATSTHPSLSALGRKLDLVPFVETMEDVGEEACIERVIGGSHAHSDTYSYIKILYSKLGHNARVYTFKEQLYPGYLVFLFHKHSPWKYKFDIGMQRLIEAGMIQKWYQTIMNEFIGPNVKESSSVLKPLSLAHLEGSFLLLLCGLFLALLVVAGEVILASVPRRFTLKNYTSSISS